MMSAALSAPQGGVLARCLVPLFCAGLLALAVGVGHAHGGPPLRLGVTAEPVAAAVARLALVHLRETVGFAVDWREFPDEGALRAAFAAGSLDLAVTIAAPEGPTAALGDCSEGAVSRLLEEQRQRWGGEAYLLGFAAGRSGCGRPCLLASRAVLEDLRFGILGKELARLAAAVTPDDVATVRAAADQGGQRAAIAASRAALAAKAKR